MNEEAKERDVGISVFVLMPFDKSYEDIYESGIKAVCDGCGAVCERVDEQIFAEDILYKVYEEIAKADLIISEMSDRNPNVYYETGYAHALGKQVILITRSVENIPFDLRHYPHIIYEGRIKPLKTKLEKKVKWHIEHKDEPISYVPNLHQIIENLEKLKNIQLQKLLQKEVSHSFINKPEIFKEMTIEPESAKVYCVTFAPNEPDRQDFEESWVEDEVFEIKSGIWGFVVHKKEIKNKLKHVDYPYKFFVRVKNTQEEKYKYYARLLEAECTVTGKGDIYPLDGNYWRVWFVINNETYHPDVEDLMRLNQALVNTASQYYAKTLKNMKNPD